MRYFGKKAVVTYAVKFKDNLTVLGAGGFDSFSMTDKAEIHMGKSSAWLHRVHFSNRNVFPSQTGLISEAIVRFPAKQAPVMDKSVHPGWADEAVTLWDAAELELETLEQPFQYHIEVDFPEDMYYYKNFQFQDELGSVHIIDKNNINLWLVDRKGKMSR